MLAVRAWTGRRYGWGRRGIPEEQAQADGEAELNELRADPKSVRTIWSAELCSAQAARSTALAAIAKERKYARIGGAIDLRRMRDLQDDVRAADDRIEAAKAGLKQVKASPVACKSPKVAHLVECARQVEGGVDIEAGCMTSDLGRLVKLLGGDRE